MSKQFLQMILIISSVLFFCGCGATDQSTISMEPSMQVTVQEPEPAEDEEEDEQVLTPQTQETIYLVMNVDQERKLIALGLPDSVRTVQYGYTRTTQILDDHGQFMSAGKLIPGRAVTIGALDEDAKLTVIQLATDTWYQENITRYSMDDSIGMLVIGDTKYRYGDHVRVFAEDQEISLRQIGEKDILAVQGLGNQILSIRVTTGHGTIELVNTELFEGGWISLGTKIYAKITPNMTLEVPEGTYELSVANNGYGDSKTIEVEREQTTLVDLNEYKGDGAKICQVTFEVYVENAKLYIDGDEIAYAEPVELCYGVHRLTVIADGFETWERQLVIHSKEAAIEIGEPQLADEEGAEEVPVDVEGSQISENESPTDGETTGAAEAPADQDTAVNEQDAGTSPDAIAGSSTGNYNDYLDTLTDLISSLVRQD